MRREALLAFFLVLLGGVALSATGYVVREGDTLWSISQRFYGNPAYWQFIWEKNSKSIKNPHWIYPGQRLIIPSVEEVRARLSGGFIEEKKVKKPVFSWELQLFVPYLTPSMPEIVGEVSREPFDPEKTIYSKGDRFEVALERGVSEGDVLLVFRVLSRDFEDPETGKSLGYLIQNLGIVRVEKVKKDKALVRLLKGIESVMAGDYLTAFRMPEPIYRFRPVAGKVRGRVVGLQEGRDVAGMGDVVLVNLGKKDGLSPGALLRIYVEPWGREVGSLVVLKTEQTTSTCYVYRNSRPVVVGSVVGGGV